MVARPSRRCPRRPGPLSRPTVAPPRRRCRHPASSLQPLLVVALTRRYHRRLVLHVPPLPSMAPPCPRSTGPPRRLSTMAPHAAAVAAHPSFCRPCRQLCSFSAAVGIARSFGRPGGRWAPPIFSFFFFLRVGGQPGYSGGAWQGTRQRRRRPSNFLGGRPTVAVAVVVVFFFFWPAAGVAPGGGDGGSGSGGDGGGGGGGLRRTGWRWRLSLGRGGEGGAAAGLFFLCALEVRGEGN